MDEQRLVITVLGDVDASVRQDGVGEVLVHGGDLGHLKVECVEGETDEARVVEGADTTYIMAKTGPADTSPFSAIIECQNSQHRTSSISKKSS